MAIFGSPLVQGPAGLNQAQRNAVREAEARKQAQRPAKARGTDEVEVHNVQAADSVRGLTGNAREETSSDRKRHGTDPDGERPRLDVKG